MIPASGPSSPRSAPGCNPWVAHTATSPPDHLSGKEKRVAQTPQDVRAVGLPLLLPGCSFHGEASSSHSRGTLALLAS